MAPRSMGHPCRAELKPYADKLHGMQFQGERPHPGGTSTIPLHGITFINDLRRKEGSRS